MDYIFIFILNYYFIFLSFTYPLNKEDYKRDVPFLGYRRLLFNFIFFGFWRIRVKDYKIIISISIFL